MKNQVLSIENMNYIRGKGYRAVMIFRELWVFWVYWVAWV